MLFHMYSMLNSSLLYCRVSLYKPHHLILDGLRVVVAIMVVWVHIFEALMTIGGRK